ncbi:galactonate dehydratase [Paenibacillus eucommiae]|uniref:Galactonate dehydratase n=1 Tax=Paenibacillus eucommiae TaxID=1355755 RepID=A0ABS4ILV6_9BACL|nr:galactonate dehydratase [Paenibacillus eucommiae]MBP1988553.1 galactonate dehydratase [Paenibacillus eucommiae]
MIISDIKTVIVNAEMRNWIFVKVETDEGIIGWGEASVEWKTRSAVGGIEDLKPFILGLDPTNIEHLYQVMTRHPFFRGGIEQFSAISGIEMACWDIFGKSLNLPVYKLLGGKVRQKIRMYDHLGGGNMDSLYNSIHDAGSMAEKAIRSKEAGFTALKVLVVPRSEPLEGSKVLNHAANLMGAIRHAVGDDMDIMVDFHGRTTPDMAIQYAKVLAPYRPFFLEEPCLPENVLGMVKVSKAVDIPIATGERLNTRFQFRELLEKGACAIVQPDICHCGGLWEARKIAALAETYYVGVAPHNPMGPIATAAAIHFAVSTPNWLIQESITSDVPWRYDVIENPVIVHNGYVNPIERPGLGVEVNEAEAAKHPFKQEVLARYWHEDGAVADW